MRRPTGSGKGPLPPGRIGDSSRRWWSRSLEWPPGWPGSQAGRPACSSCRAPALSPPPTVGGVVVVAAAAAAVAAAAPLGAAAEPATSGMGYGAFCLGAAPLQTILYKIKAS